MPIYSYVDKKSGLKVDVVRNFSEYEKEPMDEELPEAERGKKRKWSREIGLGIKTIRGPSWSGSKGNW